MGRTPTTRSPRIFKKTESTSFERVFAVLLLLFFRYAFTSFTYLNSQHSCPPCCVARADVVTHTMNTNKSRMHNYKTTNPQYSRPTSTTTRRRLVFLSATPLIAARPWCHQTKRNRRQERAFPCAPPVRPTSTRHHQHHAVVVAVAAGGGLLYCRCC
jgi:hypothetical protein